MKVRVLDELTINQIAAGEVIENPASVVKELVDNALDAGASSVCVEIKGGGRQLIRVSDDGCGMDKEDALLCLERHATSKIVRTEDLFALHTMGFRGEAIPSIAAISKMSILTATLSTGTLVQIEGGQKISCSDVPCSKGTTVEVKDLFYNVPVRKKFQKSPSFDTKEIVKIITSLSLAFPEKKFQLISDQKNLIHTTVSQGNHFLDKLTFRIQEVLGKEFLEECLPIEIEEKGIKIVGMIGLPEHCLPTKRGQTLFVNQRPVISNSIAYAIRDGYGMTLPNMKYPVFALHVYLSPNEIDVNVHPQKKEIRLHQEQLVKEIISRTVEKSLQPKEHIAWKPTSQAIYPTAPAASEYCWTFNEPSFATKKDEPAPVFFTHAELPTWKVIGTLTGYILIEKEGLCLVDQREAHKRILFEKLMQSVKEQTEMSSMQQLLIPHTFSLPKPQAISLKEHLPLFPSLGISLHEFGPSTFAVDALADFFVAEEIPSFVSAVLQELEGRHLIYKEKMKHIAQLAANKAIFSTKKLTVEEAQALVNQLMKCETPFESPQGKPTLTTISYEQIEKYFKG